MAEDQKAIRLIERYDRLVNERRMFDIQFQEIVEYVRPVTTDFNKTAYVGERRNRKIYDSTAIESLEQLASGLHGSREPPASRRGRLLTALRVVRRAFFRRV